MNPDEVIVRVTKIELLIKTRPDITVAIELRDPETDSWAVKTLGGFCINEKLLGEYEPLPSNRTDKWLKKFRFSKEEAQLIAAQYVLKCYDEAVELELKRKNRKTPGTLGVQES